MTAGSARLQSTKVLPGEDLVSNALVTTTASGSGNQNSGLGPRTYCKAGAMVDSRLGGAARTFGTAI